MYYINGEGIGFMAAKKDYAAMCSAIVSACGGEQNIANVAHCMTRLRLQLKDASTFDESAAKAVSGVIGLVVQNGEYQFVIGQDVPSLYEEFLKIESIAAGGSVDDPQTAKVDHKDHGSVVNAILSFLGGTFSPVIPVILGVLLMSVAYRWFQRVLPEVLRTVFVPLLTMLVTVPVTLLVLGPIGYTAGTVLADVLINVCRACPAVAVAFVGCFTPFLVFFGMNNALYPLQFILMAEVGSDPLICAGMTAANLAVAGACLAAAAVETKVEERSVAVGAGVTAMCSITEPGVYGVLFTKRFPLVGAMIGGCIGGIIAGITGMTQYVITACSFIAFPAYIGADGSLTNLALALTVMAVSLACAFVSTFVLGKRAVIKEQTAE